MEEIQKHPFFKSIDFKKLVNRDYVPPIQPMVNSNAKNANPYVYKETPGKTYVMIEDFTYTENNETMRLKRMDSSKFL